MNEARVYADGFERSFAEVKDLLEFLAERGRNAKWIRKPTNTLRLAPLEKEAQNLDAADASMEEILEDTEKNTQLVLKMRGESYPVRDCAIRTILSRAGVNGDGLRKLDKATYAKVVNYCLRVAKGDALIKIADGKVSAVHGGDKHDYCILDMKAMFETTCEYLNLNFKGSVYMEGSGIYDHSIVSAMWKLGGSQELLDTYRKALDAHGMDEKILSPALRFTTSDVAASGANLYPMLLTDGPNGVISLGSPIKLAHDKGATILDFRKNLEQVCARYVDAMKNLTQLMDIEIRNPVNCLKLLMKELGIKQKIRNEVVELFVSQNGEGACTAHDLYYAMNEASFFAACEGMSGQGMASNGDLGRILDCITDEDGNARAVIGFPDGRQVQYEADQMEMIEHANATTIHKAQGSECPVVIIPWVKAFYMMLKRNILYTGVTRAKSKVYLVGEWAAVCQAIHTDDSGTRNTILSERIVQYYDQYQSEQKPEMEQLKLVV